MLVIECSAVQQYHATAYEKLIPGKDLHGICFTKTHHLKQIDETLKNHQRLPAGNKIKDKKYRSI